eukprot:XP_008186840.1 PREDICTED: KRAB-A domain-containing protein 2-like [Acyrthosiphon pisum]
MCQENLEALLIMSVEKQLLNDIEITKVIDYLKASSSVMSKMFSFAPASLQSDNGREFCNELINSLREMWPDLNIVHGKPRHSQSQDSVERANQDIENILTTWMQDNNTNKWSEGLRFVQFMKNKAYHSGIKRSPYNAMFGTDPKTGLTSSILPHTILQEIPSTENRKRKQTEESQNARDNLEIQAKKMKNVSNAKFPKAKEGSTVQLKIPDVEGRSSIENLIAIYLKKNKFLYDLQQQNNQLEMDKVFLNVLLSLNAPLIDVHAVKMRLAHGLLMSKDEPLSCEACGQPFTVRIYYTDGMPSIRIGMNGPQVDRNSRLNPRTQPKPKQENPEISKKN